MNWLNPIIETPQLPEPVELTAEQHIANREARRKEREQKKEQERLHKELMERVAAERRARIAADPTIPTEERMITALAKHFDVFRNRMFMRSAFFGWEMDFVLVTGSRVLHEIEIKISAADWRNDIKKDKWKNENRAKVGRFWYAVPAPLVSKKPDWVSPDTGLIVVGSYGAQVFRPAQLISDYRVSDAELNALYQSMYYRWWTRALKNGDF